LAPHHADALADQRHRGAGRAFRSRHHLSPAEYDEPAADPDVDATGDGSRRILQPAAPLAPDGPRSRGRLDREAGLRPASSMGSAVHSRPRYRALVSVLELVERVPAARDRVGQDEATRVQGYAEVAFRARA